MLKGLSPLLSPDLLHVLASMGHGDEIVLADANFPAATHAKRLVRLPGTRAPEVLDAVLSVLPLDDFVAQAALTMQVVGDASAVPPVVGEFDAVLRHHGAGPSAPLERFVFYQRAAAAFAVVATGETRIYGNILLKKGVLRQMGDAAPAQAAKAPAAPDLPAQIGTGRRAAASGGGTSSAGREATSVGAR